MKALFHEVLYRPLLNALVWLYDTVALEDLGVAIILLTLVIRFILYPLFYKSFKHQARMQELQPKVREIQNKHRGNREQQATALMELYREHKVNPLSSFGLLLVQLPILLALYRVFLTELTPEALNDLYSFVPVPETIHTISLGLIDLSSRSILVVGLAAIAQYVQGRMSVKRHPSGAGESPAEKMARQMIFIGPAITVVILMTLPAAVGMYWLTASLFSVGQQALIHRSLKGEGTYGDVPGKSQGTRQTHGPQ